MQAHEIRKSFLEFFIKHEHRVFPSSPLIPEGDPTLLFTSAGMVRFKSYYLGLNTDLKRATSCQKCFRTTDIDNVGKTIRHLTFFEMLGNFSFGDYFKEESIRWGWEYLTKEMGLEENGFYVSVYRGGAAPKDEEARKIWESVLPKNMHDRIIELDDKNNFWAMGETGPSGPCSEIYWDRGDKFSHKGCAGLGCDCDRYIEVWNHVFTQFDKQSDGSFKPLPKKNIDTGMGLERLAFLVENKVSPFETSLFYPVIEGISSVLGVKYDSDGDFAENFRIISDHMRAAVFLISEGIIPSNEGRGYLLRRLIRRAERFGMMLGAKKPFLYKLAPAVNEIFGGVYPETVSSGKTAVETLKFEEDGFLETLETGEKLLESLFKKHPEEIPGKEAFNLYETYGFPLELTREIAFKKGVRIDEQGFEKAKKQAQETARAGWKDSGEKNAFIFQKAEEKFPATIFRGYEVLEIESSVIGILDLRGNIIEKLPANTDGYLILDVTPFYAASGGQIGDIGFLLADGREICGVVNTLKPLEKVYFHYVKYKNTIPQTEIKTGMKVVAKVSDWRHRTACHHTATHVINAALKRVFGDTTRQAGSNVSPDKFRFDYTITRTPTKEEIAAVEKIANEAVADNYKVFKMERPLKDAQELGAVTLLGEKYSDPARFVLINRNGWDDAKNRFSLELCGGTHVNELKELGVIKILKESSIARGIRRIEGVAGAAYAEKASDNSTEQPKRLAGRKDPLVKTIKAETIALEHGFNVLIIEMSGANIPGLRSYADKYEKEVQGKTVIFVWTNAEDKLSFVVKAASDISSGKFNASSFAKEAAVLMNGSGGGRKDFAQGGGRMPEDFESFKKQLVEIVKRHL